MRNTSCRQLLRASLFAECLALGAVLMLAAPAAHAATVRPNATERHAVARRASIISGRVTDAVTKAAVPGATVRVEGTSLGAVTGDESSVFRLELKCSSRADWATHHSDAR